jgi:hypothetical protein
MSALLDGRAAYCRRPPYGIDKLYVGADGSPHHVIRNLPDGTQHMLDPETGEVISTFGRNQGSGVPAHYHKQKDERIVLVPGSEEAVAVVRKIYARHHRDKWGTPRIAIELNDQGTPSPQGGQWYTGTIRGILNNPIYAGLGIANRCTSAVYHRRSQDGPVRSEVDLQVLAERARPPMEVRPRDEWLQQEYTELAGLLDEDVKALASNRHASLLDRQANGYVPKPNRDRHTNSDYILKGILRSRQGGYLMTGRKTGSKNLKTRYYAVSRGHSAPSSDKTLRQLVRAEPLEQAVLGLIQMIIARKEDLQRDVESIVKRQLGHRKDDRNDVQEWIRQRDGAAQKLNFIIEELDDVGREVARKKVETLQAQIRSLDERIRQASVPTVPDTSDAATVVKSVLDRLSKISESLHDLPKPALRRLIASFVGRAVVDLETKEVELELRLPEWALQGNDAMCLDDKFACKYDNEAHRFSGAIVLKPRLLWLKKELVYYATDFATAA